MKSKKLVSMLLSLSLTAGCLSMPVDHASLSVYSQSLGNNMGKLTLQEGG